MAHEEVARKTGVFFRQKVTINTDPQRRCYNGCHFSSEEVWTPWKLICAYSSHEDAVDSMETFSQINPSHEYKLEKTQ